MAEIIGEQRTEDWLRMRLGRVTSSTAPAILGCHPYKSARLAWREIMGLEPDKDMNRFKSGQRSGSFWGHLVSSSPPEPTRKSGDAPSQGIASWVQKPERWTWIPIARS